jgi:superfamily II RNA helicase
MSYVRVVTADEQLPTPPETPALVTGYTPDRFQAFAIQAIEAGENVLVTAKTGSGKTFVGEYQIAKSLQRGGRVFYTTPVKSLSNQKFNDLKKLFPSASVGIMTGDIKFRPDAQIIVMTTEILRNLLFKKGTLTENIGLTSVLSLNELDSVIFDEVHYINDNDRGHVWEECLILLPPSVKLILLSATLSSPFGFAKWLGESKKVRVWLISTLWRAVPLEHCVVHGTSLKTFYDSKEQYHEDVYRSYVADNSNALLAHDKFKEKVKAAIASGKEGPVAGKTRPKSFEHHLNACLGNLNEQGNLPAIVFVFSRAGCEKLAKRVEHTFIDSSDAAAVSHIWDFHLSRYKDALEFSPQAHTLKELAMRGIAYHHSGLLPFLKEILEILFSRGLCKVLFATETFAVGINMPTKTVIFTALDKFSDGGERPLKTSEYIQMAGRAGRRGKDERGLVIYLPQREPISASELKAIVCGKSASFGSQMNFHYDFLLKILNASSSITEKELIEKSYWFALEQEWLEGMKKECQDLGAQVSNIHLKPEEREECELYCDIQRRISENQNSKKKAAQRELVEWKDTHKESLWNPILSRYDSKIQLEKKMESLEQDIRMATSASNACDIPIVQKRRLLLEEYGFLEDGLRLTPYGRLSSEINEGHPFLMVELYIQQTTTLSPLCLKELLTVLSLFIGDKGEFVISELNVSKGVLNMLSHLNGTATSIIDLEHKYRIPYDNQFWTLSTEWIDPVAEWLEGTVSVAELAMKYELFEGNVQKALMKLSALLEEFQALATMSGNVDMLDKLAEARPLVLRDLVLAESLYLRV